MHVISARLGGKGEQNNLISAPLSVNSGHFRTWELAVADLVAAREKKNKAVVWMEVSVSWRGGKYSNFAERISGRAGLRRWKGQHAGSQPSDKWEKNKVASLSAEATVPRPEFHEEDLISLNFSSKTDLDKVTNSRRLSELIAENRPYTSYQGFIKTVNDAAKNTKLGDIEPQLKAITQDKNIVLKDLAEN